MNLPGYDTWRTTPPEDPPCACNREECEECGFYEAREAARDAAIDRKIDEAREER